MNEALQKIDTDLIELEERLLVELSRLRKLGSKDTYSEIEPALKSELKVIYSALVEALAATADTKELTLKSDEQLWIEDRMRVVRNLLVSKLPTAFLSLSHAEHRHHKREPGESEKHTASRELAILSEQVSQHVREGRSIEDIAKERAQFDSKELSSGHAQDTKRDIAQSPDEIRKKLAGKSGGQGPSSFAAKDLASNNLTTPELAAAGKSADIAQTPEAIKAKLAGKASSQGPSTFAAKDLSSNNPTPPQSGSASFNPTKKSDADIAQTPEAIRQKLAERQQEGSVGKASFGAKDIQSVEDKIALTEEKRKKPEKPTGKAVFNSRDLSDS